MATKEPTLKDITLLALNPSLASKFDEVYGPGAANQVLNSQSRTNLMTETRLSQPAPRASSASNYAGAVARGLVGPAAGAASYLLASASDVGPPNFGVINANC